MKNRFAPLDEINVRPRPFAFYTAADLWTDEHTSRKMLDYHLDENVDAASRRTALIDCAVEWIASRFNIGEDTGIADFGCGPGLYASRRAGKSAQVTGIDFSERSIAHAREVARQKQLDIHYLHQDYLGFTTEKQFDLILRNSLPTDSALTAFMPMSPDRHTTPTSHELAVVAEKN